MADENDAPDTGAEEVAEAKALGWADKDSWRGNPDEWVDAHEFLERGRGIMPVMRENNKRLLTEVGGLKAEMARQAEENRNMRAALAAIEKDREKDLQEGIKLERERIKKELAEASEAGDHARVAELTEEMAETARPAAPKDDDEQPPAQPKFHPEVEQWFNEHPDFVRNPRKTALANAIIAEKRQAGDTRVGRVFLDDVASEVDKFFGDQAPPSRDSKVAGGGGGSRSSGGSGGGKSYADLPADAKATCDRMANRLVGQGRAHKDIGSWRKSYAEQYFAQE